MNFEVLPVTRFRQNCSILWCERTRQAAVIDPGGDVADILMYLELLELECKVALVTHGHFDHCGAAARLAGRTGARIEGPHIGDARLVAGLAAAGAQHGFSAEPYSPARWLDHGDVVSFGDEQLDVLHCPGHSRGHVAYFSRSARQAFVGDILFRQAIGAWEHPDGDLPALVASIRDRLFPLGDDVGFVPGHGPQSTFGQERRDNPFVGDVAYARWFERMIPPHTSSQEDPAIG